MTRTTLVRALALLACVALVATACSDDDDGGDGGTAGGDGATGEEEVTDYEAIGLWDDGPCDEARDTLHIGLMTTFESPAISLEDQALALEASAEAFNARGGANGACIEVTTCDDQRNPDQAVECVRTLEDAGVVATVNDQGLAGQDLVAEAMRTAGIPRVAGNVTQLDWTDPNAYPMDASGTGVAFLLPQALVDNDASEIALIRVPQPEAAALQGLLEGVYEGEAEFVLDAPVPEGTSDYSQFILAAQEAGATGAALALGEQEAVQLVRAGQQLSTELALGSSLGTFSHASVEEFGDFAGQMVFLWSFPPATTDLPVYQALRNDLAASGEDGLQIENLKASPMRSWIGLYALLYMIREAGLQEFTGEAITTMLQESGPVPMLDIFGGEDWTPNADHPGAWKRAGTNHWASYSWDTGAEAPGGLEGNWVEESSFSFDEVLCESPFGAPEC
jgi:ABC-type branched-subunit amino acid transport system substrate-binding protein